MARVVLPIAGAVVGSFFGNPQLGWAIGAAIGNAVDPLKIKGPSIGEIAQQTSSEGGPRPFIYALSQPFAGNVIATSEPRIVKKSQSQGKGGPKVESESVYRTYAIGVCEGLITAFVKVWRNGILVYDGRNGNTADNVAFLQKARFFVGTYDQNASPDLEVIFGVGTTPAHRGTAYMVVADDDLTDLRGAIPQYMFQVSGSGSIDCEDSVAYSNEVLGGWAPNSDEVADPRLGGSRYEYRFDKGGANGYNPTGAGDAGSLDAARANAVPETLEPELLGWNRRNDTAEGIYPYNGAVAFGPDDLVRWFFFNHYTPTEKSSAVWNNGSGGPTFHSFASGADLEGKWWCGCQAISEAAHGVMSHIPPTFWSTHPDRCVEVRLVPSAPADPCEGLEPAPISGFCTLPNGNLISDDPWILDVSRTYKVMQKTESTGIAGAMQYTKRPVNPALPSDHPDYNSQAFWEAAYDAAVLAGEMAAGLTYGVHYPVTQAFGYMRTYQECIFQAESVPLPDVVTDICARAGLPAELIDVLLLIGDVRGLTVTNLYGATGALQALSQVFLFDPSNRDGKIAFIPRGANSVATITEDDMLEDEQEIERDTRGDPISIPRKLHLNYHDIDGGLSTDKQTSERAGDRRSVGEQSLQTPIILNADEAARAIVINHKVLIEDQRGELQFSLPDSFLELTTADVAIVQYQGKSVRCRITKCDTLDGYQQYMLLRDRQSAYTSNVEGIPAAPQTPPPSGVVGPTLIELLDIHILRDADDAIGLGYYVAVAGLLPAWQGALVELSYDNGANYVDSATATAAAVMGELVTGFTDHPQAIPDVINSFRVRIDTDGGELQETDLAGLLNRHNLAIVDDELIQFATADEVEEGVWEVSYLLRGRKGSQTAAHVAGERFVLLERHAISLVPAGLADIGRTLTFRATSLGTTPDTGTVVSMVYTGRTQIEREVGYLAAHRDGADLVVSWQGIGRLGAGAAVAHGARFAGYRVTFSADTGAAIVVETADQTTTQDVSALSSPVTITVEQLNDLTGPGPATEVIVV